MHKKGRCEFSCSFPKFWGKLRLTIYKSTRFSYKCFRQFEDTEKGGIGGGEMGGRGGGVIVVCLLQAEIVTEFGGRYGLRSVYTFNKESTKESCTLSHAQLDCALVYMRVQTCARRKGTASRQKFKHVPLHSHVTAAITDFTLNEALF